MGKHEIELEIYSLLELAGIEYDEIAIRKGNQNYLFRPLKFPEVKYKYVQVAMAHDLCDNGKQAWDIYGSIEDGEYKICLRTITKDITEFYDDYPPSIIVPLSNEGSVG